jgi:phosphatidylinositol-3-phosphatase
MPQIGHVVLVLEENQPYSLVMGNPAMPFLNSLATQYAFATNYFANTHPSIGNYFMLTTGQIVTNQSTFEGSVPDDNIARELVSAGKTWKVYAESLPSVGYLADDAYPYVRRHNPFSFFSDMTGTTESSNIVPFQQFSIDLANNALPNFSYLIANVNHNMHDCPNQKAPGKSTGCRVNDLLVAGDSWLKANLEPLLANPAFQQDGLLVIAFDESYLEDTQFGGGHVMVVLVGSRVRPGYQSLTFYQHPSTLRMMLEVLGVNSPPGEAAIAPQMIEFFLPQ